MKVGSGRAAVAILALALVATGSARAEKTAKPSDTPSYDTKTEYAVKGSVVDVKTHDSLTGFKDTHIIISTVKGDMEVHVGPVAFLAKRGFELTPGDDVLVTGCITVHEGKTVLVARQIKRGDRSVTLRNMSGHPVWPKNLRG